MDFTFQIDKTLSDKILNHQSTSSVIPHVTRYNLQSTIFYKINLSSNNLRGNTMLQYLPFLLAKYQDNILCRCGGTMEFKCLLLKLIEIKPTWEQMQLLLSSITKATMRNKCWKYLYVLLVVYLRIQYHFITAEISEQHTDLVRWFEDGYSRYNKFKSVKFDLDVSDKSLQLDNADTVTIYHIDELIDWLLTQRNIWGIPLGNSTWIKEVDEII
ncbi:related to Pre-mRNA-splicing factor 38 [Saccharomycodes ludwigii]|uniref:Pre-mRNA-splicing factor 38 n=1 Tax=Saccharomycodes ludwigii TaxID=36035 RepID=A0A376B987_9ASCO|nr:related to Pre-mRNA-splicing factor 38 [Saccharomycodes ludwigii]